MADNWHVCAQRAFGAKMHSRVTDTRVPCAQELRNKLLRNANGHWVT